MREWLCINCHAKVTPGTTWCEDCAPSDVEAEAVPEPDDDGYEEMSKTELYGLAQDADIAGRSKMDRTQLIEALRAG